MNEKIKNSGLKVINVLIPMNFCVTKKQLEEMEEIIKKNGKRFEK